MTTKAEASAAHAAQAAQADAAAIRHSVLLALARDRTPGWSFTGHFQAIRWPRIGTDSMTVTMPVGPQCIDQHGEIELAALLVLFDAALASPTRIALPDGTRLATTHINVQFTGVPATGELRVETGFEGETQAGALRQLLSHGTLTSNGRNVMKGNGAFVQLPPLGGAIAMAPLPWQSKVIHDPPALTLDQLDARERAILDACEAALSEPAAPHSTFLKQFWGIGPIATADGAECRLSVGPQQANRVGHVQGGISMGIAAETARLAAPNHPVLANLSAWFTGPGRGGNLIARSRVVHAGRSLAVVRTEITAEDGSRVLEATSAHAA